MRWVRRGSKHSKNAGTMGSESQTYHERRAMGHGTVRERLGKARSRVPAACPPLPVLARPLLSALNEHLLLAHIAPPLPPPRLRIACPCRTLQETSTTAR